MHVYLTQTDTTAGFLSKNKHKINLLKGSKEDKNLIIEINLLSTGLSLSRLSKPFSKRIRREKRASFILDNNKSFRLVHDQEHLKFLNKFGWMYSSSANISNKEFDLNIAMKLADIIIMDERGIFNSSPSKLYKIRKNKIKLLKRKCGKNI